MTGAPETCGRGCCHAGGAPWRAAGWAPDEAPRTPPQSRRAGRLPRWAGHTLSHPSAASPGTPAWEKQDTAAVRKISKIPHCPALCAEVSTHCSQHRVTCCPRPTVSQHSLALFATEHPKASTIITDAHFASINAPVVPTHSLPYDFCMPGQDHLQLESGSHTRSCVAISEFHSTM